MSNESPPPVSTQDNLVNAGKGLLDRLSLGGKLMCAGAVLAILSAFLNEYSMSFSIDNPLAKMAVSTKSGFMVIEEWRGAVAVLACVGCGIMAFLLFGSKPHPQSKNLTMGALVAAGVAVLMVILIWINISRANSSMDFGGMGGGMSAGAGIGAYLILLAGVLCLAGSVLHAKDAKLF